MAAALKQLNVPVVWIGLPSIRGQRSTSDMVFLNDLLRRQVEKAGMTFVPVWDAFVDDEGAFTTHGPDDEGQVRRLRSADGVYFTRPGARTLAHYAERALERLGIGAQPVALPGPGLPAQTQAGDSRREAEPGTAPVVQQRPLAGAVVPLVAVAAPMNGLMGAPGDTPAITSPDPGAAMRQVLVTGVTLAPVPGRADDHRWPEAGPAATDRTRALRNEQAAVRDNPVR
jgi:uncharacterized protein